MNKLKEFKKLKTIIELAEKKGWHKLHKGKYPNISSENLVADILNHGQELKLLCDKDFAKAYWGEEEIELKFEDSDLSWEDGVDFLGGKMSYPYEESACVTIKTEAWKYHLQQVVLSDDLIDYYYQNR